MNTLSQLQRDCPRALSALPKDRVLITVEQACTEYTVLPTSVPRSGLGMLKMTDSAFNEDFFLGEMPVSTVKVELKHNDGSTLEGGSYVLDDDLELAQAIATADALLASDKPQNEPLLALIEEGIAQIKTTQKIRANMLAKTKVDFSLLNMAGEDDDA